MSKHEVGVSQILGRSKRDDQFEPRCTCGWTGDRITAGNTPDRNWDRAWACSRQARRVGAVTRSKVYVLPRQYGGPDKRGNSRDRKRRREWLIENWRADVDLSLVPWGPREVPLGEGEPACRCYRCGDLLTVGTVTADRRVPGVNGGTYRQDNIRPACFGCNASTGGAIRGRRAA